MVYTALQFSLASPLGVNTRPKKSPLKILPAKGGYYGKLVWNLRISRQIFSLSGNTPGALENNTLPQNWCHRFCQPGATGFA
jgi:hypothetical protein